MTPILPPVVATRGNVPYPSNDIVLTSNYGMASGIHCHSQYARTWLTKNMPSGREAMHNNLNQSEIERILKCK
jgi:hypothetical protein